MEWALNPDVLKQILPMLQPRLDRLSDIGKFSSYFLSGHLELSVEQFTHKKLSPEQIKQSLIWGMWRLDELKVWKADGISTALRECATELELKPREFFAPFYPAITGMKSATPLFDTMAVLGRDLVRARLRDASKILGGLSKKGEARWKKTYESARKQRLEQEARQVDL